MEPEQKRPRKEDTALPEGVTLKLQVSLPSGRCEEVSVATSGTVCDVKVAAQKALRQPFLRLAGPGGRLLNPRESLQVAGLENGNCIFAVAQQPKIAATDSAFALCVGGQVVTWGDRKTGGDSTTVRHELEKVEELCATGSAFAALADGSVITWGDPNNGGDCSPVRGKLRKVQKFHATQWAFAALMADKTVVTWGNPLFGGDSTAVQGQLKDVKSIHATDHAFAAILADGTVVTWGGPDGGGDSKAVQGQLKDVKSIHATDHAFAAILADESVVTWGDSLYGGDCMRVQAKLKNVQEIHATSEAFVAILADKKVVAWGSKDFIADDERGRKHLPEQLMNGEQVCASRYVLAATFGGESVVTFGGGLDVIRGIPSSRHSSSKTIRFQHPQNFQQVCSTGSYFAAILADGTLTAPGPDARRLCNVQQLHATTGAFAAILADGSLVTWGDPNHGGDSAAVQAQLVYL
eukprot:s555_g4.t1